MSQYCCDKKTMDGEQNDFDNHTNSQPPAQHCNSAPTHSYWQDSIDRTVTSVVTIRLCHPFPFDGNGAHVSKATGFVVDAEKGYIMTNRHVCGPGPVHGFGTFKNKQERPVWSVYVDPVHDFGFLRFDPTPIKDLSINALELCPGSAKVGLYIRVIGNDEGNELSILSGVISRLDCNAPTYRGSYSDFNINYIQASASASRGSSGSPVIDEGGSVVAVQAGGSTRGTTNYFLPLERPHRALKLLQQGQAISRGTIQTQWELRSLDDCLKRGLTSERESEIRNCFPEGTGMLVAKLVLPDGPAFHQVEEGDLLLCVNGELLTQFAQLDKILDDNVGKTISITIQRRSQEMELKLVVGDLHAITPNKLAIVVSAYFHDLSYNQARRYNTSLKDPGVCIYGESGLFSFGDRTCVRLIERINRKSTPNLGKFTKVFSQVLNTNTTSVLVEYRYLNDRHTTYQDIVPVDKELFALFQIFTRNVNEYRWNSIVVASDAVPVESQLSSSARHCKTPLHKPESEAKTTNHLRNRSWYRSIQRLQDWKVSIANRRMISDAADGDYSFVQVYAETVRWLDGFPFSHTKGAGIIIDAKKRLVIVSRTVVPNLFCSVRLVIDETISVKAKIEFFHPNYGFAIVSYESPHINVRVKTPRFATKYKGEGTDTILIGRDDQFQPVKVKTVFSEVAMVEIGASPEAPRYRAMNFEGISLGGWEGELCDMGVLASRSGTVLGIWLRFLDRLDPDTSDDYVGNYGIAAPILQPVIAAIQAGVYFKPRILNVQFQKRTPNEYFPMGVRQEWIDKIDDWENSKRRTLFMVHKVDSSHDAGFRKGDILLQLNNKFVTQTRDLDVAYHKERLNAVIVRSGEKCTIQVFTLPAEAADTSHMVEFCGTVFQEPHLALRQHVANIPSKVYMAGTSESSPMKLHDIPTKSFVTKVNNEPTPNMSSFREAIAKIGEEDEFTMHLETLSGLRKVVTLQNCSKYYPIVERRRGYNSITENGL